MPWLMQISKLIVNQNIWNKHFPVEIHQYAYDEIKIIK